MSGTTKTQGGPLYTRYPITSKWEFTLKNGDRVSGEIFCTDPVSDVVVLQEHSDIRMISAGSIQDSKLVKDATEDTPKLLANMAHTKKALEEREKRAIKLAQER